VGSRHETRLTTTQGDRPQAAPRAPCSRPLKPDVGARCERQKQRGQGRRERRTRTSHHGRDNNRCVRPRSTVSDPILTTAASSTRPTSLCRAANWLRNSSARTEPRSHSTGCREYRLWNGVKVLRTCRAPWPEELGVKRLFLRRHPVRRSERFLR
jgi:hypothetical protein